MLPAPEGTFTDGYFLIELQGAIRSPDGKFDGRVLGQLTINSAGNPEIILGHHVLEGKMEPLKKHLIVFKKTGKRTPYFTNEDGDGNVMSEVHEALGVVKWKAIFQTRARIEKTPPNTPT
ncbi:Chromosome transmission fidelity protein 8 [Perkinsus chesapeaki]|uniref:Chromosome transmission fidelity protein 8 n=1 Tax=Perkinsus chesapeaki TaxID=330153 RepID=A0A7J6LA88_PERCH|nr:Chromosome transmission fidelity protein 8 [Perkinsus chesapeaki]